MIPQHRQVIVVGAGPVGLTTAINVAKLGVEVLVLERGAGIDQSPRATSYQPCVLAEMVETGIYDDVRKKSQVNDVLTFWLHDGTKKKRVAAAPKREGGKIFAAGLNCGQPVLAGIILDHLTRIYPSSQVLFNQQVTGITQADGIVTVTCKESGTNTVEYTCDWLVGADGAGSSVRKLLGVTFDGFSWPKEDFVATNLYYPFADYGFTTANFLMDSVNWAVVTVIDEKLWRCAFGVRAGLNNEEIRAELDEHYKHILPGWSKGHKDYELVQLNKYKPHQRCASAFRIGRCFLAGDAAHSNNPVGGLGLTTGLLDAGPLGRALGAVINGRAPESILDTWATSRREKWLTFTNPYSIENKRMIQRGGYSEDPLGIWKDDEIAKEHGMEQWVATATESKKEEDERMFKSFEDPEASLKIRMRQWAITMNPLWMAQYEDQSVIELRMSLRPSNEEITAAL